MSAPSLPSFTLPRFSGIKGPRQWGVPKWSIRNGEDTSLLANDEQYERDRYTDDAEDSFDASSRIATPFPTGESDPTPVEVVGKKERKARTVSSPDNGADGAAA